MIILNSQFLRSLAYLAFFTGALSLQAERKPNILFYLTDDLGYGDIGCYGAEGQYTPAIDQLAKEGTKFSSFYVHQRCSPSRAAFMTGSYAHRVGLPQVIYKHREGPIDLTLRKLHFPS